MALRNPDGTPYRASGSISQFKPNSPEACLINFEDQELIKAAGSPIFYYELFIQSGTIDPLYREDRSKLWSPVPVQLYALYEPIASEFSQDMFGIDSPSTDMKFELNLQAVLQALGHLPKVGSRIFTPHKREHWELVFQKTSEFQLWGEFRLNLICRRFQENITTHEGAASQPTPDFKIN